MSAQTSFAAFRSQRTWVLPIPLLLVANVALAGIWTYPHMLSSQRRVRSEAQATSAVELLLPSLERASRSYGALVRAEDDLASLRRRIEKTSGSVADLVEAFHGLVDDVGLRLVTTSTDLEEIDELGLAELQMTVRVSGPYSAVRQLVSRLRTDPAFVALEQVVLGTPERGGSQDRLTIELQLSAFIGVGAGPASTGPGAAGGVEQSPAAGSTNAENDLVDVARRLRQRLESLPPLPLASEDYTVHLDLLDTDPQTTAPPSRNLFSFADEPRPQAPFGTPESGSGEDNDEDPVPPTPAANNAPTVPYRLIGIVTSDTRRLGAFTDGTTLNLVGVGGRLPGGFEVVALGIDWAELGHGDSRTRLRLERESP